MRDHAAYISRRHFGSLDGVRCFAIVAVVWHHSQSTQVDFLARGFLGVDLFFVLSGYLIVTLLLRERDTKGAISLRQFYIRRSLRIFPLYYGVLLGLTLLYLWRPAASGASTFFAEWPIYLTYTSNWVHASTVGLAITWSLAAEEQFYVVWPMLERLLRRSVLWGVLAASLLANQAVNFGLLDDAWRAMTGTEPDLEILDATFTPILLGVVLAHTLHLPTGFARVRVCCGHRWASVTLLLALVLAVACSPGDISGLPRLTFQLLMTNWLASLVIREDHAMAGVLSWPPIVRLGVVSYGIYLLHNYGIAIADRLLGQVPALGFEGMRFIAGLFCSVVLAEISFRFYESWFLRLKQRFAHS